MPIDVRAKCWSTLRARVCCGLHLLQLVLRQQELFPGKVQVLLGALLHLLQALYHGKTPKWSTYAYQRSFSCYLALTMCNSALHDATSGPPQYT